MNLFALVSIHESDNLIIVTNSKIDVTFGRFENYYAQNFAIFTINNSSFSLNNTNFSNFASVLIYSAIGSIKIDNCNLNNEFLSFSYVNEYVIMLEDNVSFLIKNSEFKFLRTYNKESINFLKTKILNFIKVIYLTNIITLEFTNSIEDCFFKNNKIVMYNLNLGDLKIIRCNFSMNNLIPYRNNRETINNIKINYIAVDFGVSTIYLFNSQSNSFLQIFSSIFIDNNGSIYFEEVGNFSIKNSYFSNNYGFNGGGALFLLNSQSNSMIQIMSSNFTDNNSPNFGGAIHFGLFGNLSIYSSHFRNNNAGIYGGAIYLGNSQSEFDYSNNKLLF